jgi:phenylpropionate dioxygenase-like ring-hydroxylating dioxygenase large terminal subunit
MKEVQRTGAWTQGYSLEQRFYRDPAIFDVDLEHIFLRHWLFAGHASRIPKPGDYFLFDFAGESLIIVRTQDQKVRAFYNVCRHRGSRICIESSGSVRSFACPYHRWTYRLDGTLAAAKHMPADFHPRTFALDAAHVRVLEDLIFVSLAAEPPEFGPVERDLRPHLRPHGLSNAKICHTSRYDIRANWKLVVENSRECYHCPPAHPEYCRIMGFAAGIDSPRIAAEDEEITAECMARWSSVGLETRTVDFTETSWHHAIRMPFRKGHVSQSLDGKAVGPLMGTLVERDVGALAVVIYPSFWFEASSDYAMLQRFLPVGPEITQVEMNWLVRDNAREGADYNVERVTAFWKATAQQDRIICENNQAGVDSRRYRPGRYSLVEGEVEKFVGWYLGQVGSL